MTKQEVIERIGYVKALVSESYTISNTEESEQWDKIDTEFGELVNMVKQLEEKPNTCIHGKTLISECGLCQMDMDEEDDEE